MGGEFKNPLPKDPTGHTEWVDGRTHQTGFTATFSPNTQVSCTESNVLFDVDWTNQQEGKSSNNVTFAAVTARSYHTGLVHTAMVDGSVHTITNGIDLAIWQAMATRAGSETVHGTF